MIGRWRTRYPLPDRTVRILTVTRWPHAGFALVSLTLLLTTPLRRDGVGHGVSAAAGVALFATYFLATRTLLLRDRAARAGRASQHGRAPREPA